MAARRSAAMNPGSFNETSGLMAASSQFWLLRLSMNQSTIPEGSGRFRPSCGLSLPVVPRGDDRDALETLLLLDSADTEEAPRGRSWGCLMDGAGDGDRDFETPCSDCPRAADGTPEGAIVRSPTPFLSDRVEREGAPPGGATTKLSFWGFTRSELDDSGFGG